MEVANKVRDLKSAVIFCSRAGGELNFITPDGELVLLGFPPGAHRLGYLMELIDPDSQVEVVQGTVFIKVPGRAAPVVHSAHGHTGANQTFRPARLTDNEAQILRMMKGLQRQVSQGKKRERLLEQLVNERQVAPERSTTKQKAEAKAAKEALAEADELETAETVEPKPKPKADQAKD